MAELPVNSQTPRKGRQSNKQLWISVIVFALVLVAGLYYVKWSPYYAKALIAAAKHSIGSSIVSGKAAAAPAPSWAAAWGYTVAYFTAVWKAVVLGLLLGSLVQVLIPRNWVLKVLGKAGLGSTLAGSMLALPSMLCTCCAAPVAVGLRKRSASPGAALAYWLANPLLNPATLIFMGFVLSWKFTLLRIVAGVLLVFGLGYLANVLSKGEQVSGVMPEDELNPQPEANLFVRWVRALWPLLLDTVPAYFIMVVLLGAVRAWLFPAVSPVWAGSIAAIAGFALAGTLFIIPTAAEIPIVQTLMSFGLGVGPAAALIITLPAVSLPSLLMVRRVFSAKVLALVTASVIVCGIALGLLAKIVW